MSEVLYLEGGPPTIPTDHLKNPETANDRPTLADGCGVYLGHGVRIDYPIISSMGFTGAKGTDYQNDTVFVKKTARCHIPDDV